MIKRIIVHGGRAHLDDVFACGIALAEKGPRHPLDDASDALVALHGPVPIERRDPSEAELADPSVLCLDVGRSYEAELGNFDHHQLPKDSDVSAMRLIARHLRVPTTAGESTYDALFRKLFPWWDTLVSLDQHGPYVTAEERGLAWEDVLPFLGPLAEIWLKRFERAETPERRGQIVYEEVTGYIETKVRAYVDIADHLLETDVGPTHVLDFTGVSDKTTCEDASGVFLRRQSGGVAVFIARPRRSGEDWTTTGVTVMRIGKDPSVDFRRASGRPSVTFVHANGFLAQLKTRDWAEISAVIRMAHVPEEVPA